MLGAFSAVVFGLIVTASATSSKLSAAAKPFVPEAIRNFYPESIQLNPKITMPNHFAKPTEKVLAADTKYVLARTLGLHLYDLKVRRFFIDKAGLHHVYIDRVIHGIPGTDSG
jgi:hypothetical protein